MKLTGKFVYCYGINYLNFEFDFLSADKHGNPLNKAYAIYAPNGVMKSSFAKTFLDYSKNGKGPDKEERFKRNSICNIEVNEKPINPQMICVVDSSSGIDSGAVSNSVTNILVDPKRKERYDNLIIEIDKKKKELLRDLNKSSGVKQIDIEGLMLEVFNEQCFPECLERFHSKQLEEDYSPFKYSDIFSKSNESLINSLEFQKNSREFTKRYQELFDIEGSIFKRGVFNPGQAKESIVALEKSGFFNADHQVKLCGDVNAISKDEYECRYNSCIERIESDERLRTIRGLLDKNESTKALFRYLEELDNTKVAFLLKMLFPENQSRFKRDLWIHYLQGSAYTSLYLDTYNQSKEEIAEIEAGAEGQIERWTNAVALFNDRFVDMPCELDIVNSSDAVLGKEKAILVFKFKDGDCKSEMLLDEIKTLSTGELRAFSLLNVIFEAAYREENKIKTLFIFDDIVDSFDYKNKAAIIQYLDDLTKIDSFYQIILTHNFDFYRALALSFVARNRCLTTVIDDCDRSIQLIETDGINNCFIGMIKPKIKICDSALCASIPFTRNIIEYTKGNDDANYKTLTKLLHWKETSESLTIKDYLLIYNNIFSDNITRSDETLKVTDLIFSQADLISCKRKIYGFNITDKIVLCMAIRIRAERFMISTLLENDPLYSCKENNPFGSLLSAIKCYVMPSDIMSTLNKISITVSSNLHLNSFMYEPIVDLCTETLIDLYNRVKDLDTPA